MGPGSIVLGIVAFVLMLGGILFTLVPIAGSVMSFGAPVVSLAGLILGGIGYSRARRDLEATGAPVAGMIINGIAFFVSLAFALVCGTCNAVVTAVGASSPFLHVDTGSVPVPLTPPPASTGSLPAGAAPVAPPPLPPLPPPPSAPTTP